MPYGVIEKKNSEGLELTFPSIASIPGYINEMDHLWGDGSRIAQSSRWCLNTDLEAAKKIASNGGVWPEGTKKMVKLHAGLAAAKSDGRIPALDYDVTGYLPDIPAFLAGDPACMMNDGEDVSDRRKVVTIGVHIGRQGSVDASSVMNRGAAILSAIDDIEDSGYRVELTALWRNGSGSHWADLRVVVKHPEDDWSPASVAFALCHPAFSRRLMFRLAETDTRSQMSGYGHERAGAAEDFDIYFSRQQDDWSIEDAIKIVTTTIERSKVDDDE